MEYIGGFPLHYQVWIIGEIDGLFQNLFNMISFLLDEVFWVKPDGNE